MSAIGIMHMLAGWIALGAGLLNLLRRKGTRGHRALGTAFVASMAAINLSALTLYNLTGHFNLFHAFAVLSLAVTVWAILPFLRRGRGYVGRHARRMQGAYTGLCAAAANEILTREALGWMPALASRFWLLSVVVTVLVLAAGTWLAWRQRMEVGRAAAAT